MRTVRVLEHISLDGVIQAPGGPDEDRDGAFAAGGWIRPFADPIVSETIISAHGARFDLLLGRRTYDIWSGYWPTIKNTPISDGFNAATKYVATHRPDSLCWGPSEDLGANIAEGIRRIKSKGGPDLIVWGSSTVTPVLLEHGLAEEILLFVYPVLLGKGKRFFPDRADPRSLKLVKSAPTRSGVVISRYEPSATIRTADFKSGAA